MNDREILVELLDNATVTQGIYMGKDKPVFTQEVKAIEKRHVPEVADYLISHGVTVQKHGRWIPQDDRYVKFMCSVCGSKNYDGGSNYCPYCGAKNGR